MDAKSIRTALRFNLAQLALLTGCAAGAAIAGGVALCAVLVALTLSYLVYVCTVLAARWSYARQLSEWSMQTWRDTDPMASFMDLRSMDPPKGLHLAHDRLIARYGRVYSAHLAAHDNPDVELNDRIERFHAAIDAINKLVVRRF